jgi:hypothetical protein
MLTQARILVATTLALASSAGAQTVAQTVAPASLRREVPVLATVLAEYVGVYEVAPGIAITVTREKDQLSAQMTGQPALPIYPESESRFFLKAVDAQIDFMRDGKGAVSYVVLHQAGRDVKAVRSGAIVIERKTMTVPRDVLDTYVGTYTLQPGFDIQITLEEGQLAGHGTGQGRFPLSAETNARFFNAALGLDIEFIKNAQGAVTGMEFQQGPATLKAVKK